VIVTKKKTHQLKEDGDLEGSGDELGCIECHIQPVALLKEAKGKRKGSSVGTSPREETRKGTARSREWEQGCGGASIPRKGLSELLT